MGGSLLAGRGEGIRVEEGPGDQTPLCIECSFYTCTTSKKKIRSRKKKSRTLWA